MNALQKKLNARKVYDSLDKSYHYKEGDIKINAGNTFEHELSKFLLCWDFAANNQSFITEAVFKNGMGRGDIVLLDTAEVLEIVCSEKPDGHKDKKYPLQVMYLSTEKVLKNRLLQRVVDLNTTNTKRGEIKRVANGKS
jgi:hypothetical protein